MAVHALRTVLSFITGSLLRDADAASSLAAASPIAVASRRDTRAASGMPSVAAAADALARCDHDQEFHDGLDLIIDAPLRRLDTRPEKPDAGFVSKKRQRPTTTHAEPR